MLGLSPKEILIINGIVGLLFGSKKIPALTKNLVDGIIRLKRGVLSEEVENMPDKATKFNEKDIPKKADKTS